MPYNVLPKNYAFTPTPVGSVLLKTHSARRSRLTIGGSFFRSREKGSAANLLELTLVEDLSDASAPEGLFVVHNTRFNPTEQIFPVGISLPSIDLISLNLAWDEELRISVIDKEIRAIITGIRWQIADGEEIRKDLGAVIAGKFFVAPGITTFKLSNSQFPPDGMIVLRPRTHLYTLVVASSTDATSSIVTTGWDTDALRAAVNANDTWIRMPTRGTAADPTTPDSGSLGEDVQDKGSDTLLSAFAPVFMLGADGLPVSPAGVNTGPDRALVHLNYAEKDDGSMGDFNRIYEWVGSTAASGNWQEY